MKLICYEVKKCIGSRSFFIYLGFLIVVNALLLVYQIRYTGKDIGYDSYAKMSDQLSEMTFQEQGDYLDDQYERALAYYDLNELITAIGRTSFPERRAELSEEVSNRIEQIDVNGWKRDTEYTDSLYKELAFMEEISEEYRAVSGYGSFIATVMKNEETISTISIFKGNTYQTKEASLIAEEYRDLPTDIHDFYLSKGLQTFMTFKATDVMMIAGMILLSTSIGWNEKKTDMISLTWSTAKGRRDTAFAKIKAFFVLLAMQTAAFYSVNLLLCAETYGLPPMTADIHTTSLLTRSPLSVSVGTYIILFFVLKWASSLMLGVLILAAITTARRYPLALVTVAGVCIGCFALRIYVSPLSRYSLLYFMNPYGITQIDEILSRAIAVKVFGRPVLLKELILMYASSGTASAGAAYISLYSHSMFLPKEQRRKQKNIPQQIRPKSITYFEWNKLLITNGGLVFLAIFLAGIIYMTLDADYSNTRKEQYYKYYYSHLEGIYTEEKQEWLEQEYEKFLPIQILNEQYRLGYIDEQKLSDLLQIYGSLNEEKEIADEMIQRLNDSKLGGDSVIVYGEGYKRLFELVSNGTEYINLAVIIFMVSIFNNYFLMEQEGGTVGIISATGTGLLQTIRAKLIVSDLVCVMIGSISYMPSLTTAVKRYYIGSVMLPVTTLEFINGHVIDAPILVYLIGYFFLRIFLLTTMKDIMVAMSCALCNSFLSFSASFMVFAGPLVADMTGMLSLSGDLIMQSNAFAVFESSPVKGAIEILLYGLLGITARKYMPILLRREDING